MTQATPPSGFAYGALRARPPLPCHRMHAALRAPLQVVHSTRNMPCICSLWTASCHGQTEQIRFFASTSLNTTSKRRNRHTTSPQHVARGDAPPSGFYDAAAAAAHLCAASEPGRTETVRGPATAPLPQTPSQPRVWGSLPLMEAEVQQWLPLHQSRWNQHQCPVAVCFWKMRWGAHEHFLPQPTLPHNCPEEPLQPLTSAYKHMLRVHEARLLPRVTKGGCAGVRV